MKDSMRSKLVGLCRRLEEIDAMFDERTRAVFGETVANPALDVLDSVLYNRYKFLAINFRTD